MHRTKLFAAGVFALLLAAACGSSRNPIGDIFGTGTNSYYDIRGTVDSVDTSSQSIYLTNVSGYNSNLMGTGGNTARVYYDNRTTVTFQGRTYRPQDLERGDEVVVHAAQSGSQLIAQSMDVTYNSRGGMTSGSTVPYGSFAHGTVRSVDTYNRAISIDRGYGSTMTVYYDANTPVYFNGRTYSPSNLEVGDEVDIRTSDLGRGRLGAQDITVTRSMSGTSSNGTYGSPSNYATIRGTVRSVDTYNRTIALDSTTWMSGFRGNNTRGNTITVQYDPNARVSVNGQLYPLTDLQRGDVVDVQVQNDGGSTYYAQGITLVRDVNQR